MAASIGDNRSTPATGTVLRAPANRVSRKAIAYWATRAAVGWVVIAAVQVVWMLLWDPGPATPHVVGLVITTVVAVGHLAVMPQWRYRVHRYEITPDVAYTQSGWFNIERRIAPTSRIQTVDTKRGPFQQLFGLTEITVTTASAAGPVKIDGLAAADAERLVAELSAYTRETPGDAT